MSKDKGVPLAIVGLACRFPGDATNPAKFWEMLKAGRDAYSPETTRFNAKAFHHPDKNSRGTIPTRAGHFMREDPYAFDAAFFSLSAAEAVGTDPRQRIGLEIAYEAFENAGLPLERIKGSKTTVCVGASFSDYEAAVRRDIENGPRYAGVGTTDEVLANRISHFFDLRGPSMTIQTACSSSLVAVHLACQSIRTGEADMAIASGVHCILNADSTIMVANLSFLSSGGRSLSFDEAGDGYGRGEGCGAVIIKRHEDAIRDGDPIRAIVKGSGMNSDGWTHGITLPNSDAQRQLIHDVYERFDLDMGATQFVECHGTGTRVGDPAEIEAIFKTIGRKASPSRPLLLGSVKPNIGHLEPSAGVAGLIKGILAMEQGMIPPQIHLNSLNTRIPFDEWNLLVPRKLTPWPLTEVKQMSISSFGMGGTNAHVVLHGNDNEGGRAASLLGKHERNLPRKRPILDKKRMYAFSASDRAGIQRVALRVAEDLQSWGPAAFNPENLANLAYTLGERRSKLSWKSTCFADNGPDLIEKLETVQSDGAIRSSGVPRIGFVFTGQGAQWPGMGVSLLERTAFGVSVAQSARYLKACGCDWDVVEELERSASKSRLSRPQISQPICTVLQIALVEELRSWGIKPSRCVGHSSGEIAAAYCIGALSHEDAVAVAYFRGQASSFITEKRKDLQGGMMAVGLGRHDAEQWIDRVECGTLVVACVNSPQSVTVSGDLVAIDQLLSMLQGEKIFVRKLKVEVAYHSQHMSEVVRDYLLSISDIIGQRTTASTTEMISSVTGDLVDPEELGSFYWARNLTSPVEFSDALVGLVTAAGQSGGEERSSTVDLLIELGPHSSLSGPVQQVLDANNIKNIAYASAMSRNVSGMDTLFDLAADLFTRGVPVCIEGVNDDLDCTTMTNLSPYPWNHTNTFNAASRLELETLNRKHPRKSLVGLPMPMMDETERVWRGFLSLDDEPWIRDHRGLSTVLFPASGMVCMILEAAQQMADSDKIARTFKLRDVAFMAAMPMSENTPTETTIHVRPQIVSTAANNPSSWFEFTISSCKRGERVLLDNCRGLMAIDYMDSSEQMKSELELIKNQHVTEYSKVLETCPFPVDKSVFYELAKQSSWYFGPLFQSVDSMRLGKDQYTYEVFAKDYGHSQNKSLVDRPFLIHPAMLDAVFQIPDRQNDAGDQQLGIDKAVVPVSVGEFEISSDIPAYVGAGFKAYCTTKRHGLHNSEADACWFDDQLSKVYLSVSNLCRAEVAFTPEETGETGTRADTSELCASIHWDYSLELLERGDMEQAFTGASSTDLTQALARIVLHTNPATTVIELLSDSDITKSAMSYGMRATAFPGQIRYAIASAQDSNNCNDMADAFCLGEVASSDIAPVDLIIVSCGTMEGFEVYLDRLLDMNLAPTTVICTAENEVLTERGYGSERGHGLYNLRAEMMTNGIMDDIRVTVIMPHSTGEWSKQLSAQLCDIFNFQDYTVKVVAWDEDTVDVVRGTIVMSLLEIDASFLDGLSEKDFLSFQSIVTSAKRIVWLTYGNDPIYSMIDGLSRVIREEVGGIKFDVLHLSQATGLQHGARLANRIVATHSKDSEWREVSGVLQVGRLSLDHEQNAQVNRHLTDWVSVMPLKEYEGPLRLAVGKPGLLDTLHFTPDDRWVEKSLDDDEVEIEVKSSGLNFRDVMLSMGVLNDPFLGFEVGGVVKRVGGKVVRVQSGDRVAACASGAHATLVRTKEFICAKVPDDMTYETAAAVSVVHVTAYHALINLGRLRKGQSVLIHAAAGGVGQAALQLANHLGLVIYATVGSIEKRKLLVEQYRVDPEHIFNSRDVSFVHGIRRMTNKRGVDCILNSLSGELLRQSWYCLATFGVFVEIGLRDVVGNTRLDMNPFMGNTTFTLFNLVTVIEKMPHLAGEMFAAVHDLIRRGVLTAPTSLTSYPMGDAENAFRLMQSGRHLGKLVLTMDHESPVPVLHAASYSLKLDPNSTYLLVGGLGGLGRSLAGLFIDSGARNLAFVSRSGDEGFEAKKTVAQLTARLGVTVKVYRADIADKLSLEQALGHCAAELPPIRGVVQMAMVLRDALFERMTFNEWSTSLRSKVHGTRNLNDFFTVERPLDFMIFFSSVAGLVGNPGQANYATGNTYQDELAHHRRRQGLKAVSVDLGIMRDVGVVAETGAKGFLAIWEKTIGIRESVFHALMRLVINQQSRANFTSFPAHIGTGLPTANAMARDGLPRPQAFDDPRMAHLALKTILIDEVSSKKGPSDSIESRLAKAEGVEKVTSVIAEALVQKTADMLQMESTDVNPQEPLSAYGVDSLVAIEVRNWISREMKVNIPLLEILAAIPMDKFAAKVAGMLSPSLQSA